jgi:hypothetical protein
MTVRMKSDQQVAKQQLVMTIRFSKILKLSDNLNASMEL